MADNTISLIARIRENANKFIVKKLEDNNITGLVPSHGDILAVLYTHEKCTMKFLADKIHRTKATLTVLVDKLISLDLIQKEKSAEDNRVTYIKLTNKGLSYKPIFEEISNELNVAIYKDFTSDEKAVLNKLLEKMRNNIQ